LSHLQPEFNSAKCIGVFRLRYPTCHSVELLTATEHRHNDVSLKAIEHTQPVRNSLPPSLTHSLCQSVSHFVCVCVSLSFCCIFCRTWARLWWRI